MCAEVCNKPTLRQVDSSYVACLYYSQSMITAYVKNPELFTEYPQPPSVYLEHYQIERLNKFYMQTVINTTLVHEYGEAYLVKVILYSPKNSNLEQNSYFPFLRGDVFATVALYDFDDSYIFTINATGLGAPSHLVHSMYSMLKWVDLKTCCSIFLLNFRDHVYRLSVT